MFYGKFEMMVNLGCFSGKLTWLAGKWTRIESMYSLLKAGDFPASHLSYSIPDEAPRLA